jgi:pyruvate/2-oxoglutarate dehydrogenase complex dihydrolipoamide acyltransferase (E2) component
MGTRAREGKMGMDEFAGGTFTISNGGMLFVLFTRSLRLFCPVEFSFL